MNIADRRRSQRKTAKPVSPVGEELIVLAGRAGLDVASTEDLRRLIFDWSERFRRRVSGQQNGVPDAALVALTVSYLRRLRRVERRRASGD